MEHINYLHIDKIVRQDRKVEKFNSPFYFNGKHRATHSDLSE